MIKLPRTTLSPTQPVNVHANLDLALKQITTRMPSIHVRTGPVISDPAASIASTTIYTTSAVTQELGHFRVIITTLVTRVGTAGTVTATLNWNNGFAAQSVTGGVNNLTVLGGEALLSTPIFVGVGQTVSYSTSVVGATGSPAYQVYVKLEFMS